MPDLVTSYTEETLAAYVQSSLGPVATHLGWTTTTYPDGHYDEVINDVKLSLNVTTFADLTGLANVTKLRRIAEYFAWKRAKASFVLAINFSADGASFQRETLIAHIDSMLRQAEYDVAVYGLTPMVASIQVVDRPDDPYVLRGPDYYAQ